MYAGGIDGVDAGYNQRMIAEFATCYGQHVVEATFREVERKKRR
jgi:hypothetical protein